jgi:deoxyribonuclease-4
VRLALHIDPPLAEIPAALRAHGLDAFQTYLRDPHRYGKTGVPDDADRAAYLEGAKGAGFWGVVHATFLTNLASPDGKIRNASASSLAADLGLAAKLGIQAVCFHPGAVKGNPDEASAYATLTRKVAQVVAGLDDVPATRPLVENQCEGGELCKTLAELGRLFREVGAPKEKLGLLLDTCHLHAAGFDLSGEGAGDRLAEALQKEGLLDRISAFHLNDCIGEVGCGRDRHAVPGEGSIAGGLRSIARHPAFAALPAVLEMSIDEALRGVRFLGR